MWYACDKQMNIKVTKYPEYNTNMNHSCSATLIACQYWLVSYSIQFQINNRQRPILYTFSMKALNELVIRVVSIMCASSRET